MSYILTFIFEESFGIACNATSQQEVFLRSPGHKLSYGSPPVKGIPYLPASGLLFETGISHEKPSIIVVNDTPVLFAAPDEGGLLPFDILAASFWLLSRYEEYQPFEADLHGRFPAAASLLFRHNLLHLPLVNIWMDQLKKGLAGAFPGLEFNRKPYRFIPTIDVDTAWAYLHKPLWRQVAALAKGVFAGNWKNMKERFAVLRGKEPDPFDTFGTIIRIHQGKETPLFFFLLGSYGRHGKNLHPRNRHFRHLIRSISTSCEVGIHPSYPTLHDPQLLNREVDTLRRITESTVLKSRQHFLRFRLPQTYRSLISAGITEDYSMGFADQPGFRAGTCSPFRFYDLEQEKETRLWVYPLCVMDGTFRDYLGQSAEQALAVILPLAGITRQYQGAFVTLFHNESLSGKERWSGWEEMYREMAVACSAFRDENGPLDDLAFPQSTH